MSEALELSALTGPELQALLELETESRVIHARKLDLINKIRHRGIAKDNGYPSEAKLLTHLLRISPRKAKTWVEQADLVAESVTPTGHVAPAALPVVREALQEGALDPDHVEVIATAVQEVPDWAGAENRTLVEATLVGTARAHHPRVVHQQAKILLARIDQDGENPHQEAELAEPAIEMRYQQDRNGWVKLRAHIDPEAGEELLGLISELGKPQPLPNGLPDPRPIEQRHGQALTQAIHAIAQADVNTPGTHKPHLHVILNAEDLTQQTGTATLDGGPTLPMSAVRRLACDAGIIPVVLNKAGAPLDVGYEYRLVQPYQRKALIARDKGCAFPGCHLPARWTDAHHILEWSKGGKTDLRNMVLLCRSHHRLVHHSDWSVHMIKGLPYFKPPKWLDREQKLLRNILRA